MPPLSWQVRGTMAANEPAVGALFRDNPVTAHAVFTALIQMALCVYVLTVPPSVWILYLTWNDPYVPNMLLRVWLVVSVVIQTTQVPLRVRILRGLSRAMQHQGAAQRQALAVAAQAPEWKTNQRLGMASFGLFLLGSGHFFTVWIEGRPCSPALFRMDVAALAALGGRLTISMSVLYFYFIRQNGTTGFPVSRAATTEMLQQLDTFTWPRTRRPDAAATNTPASASPEQPEGEAGVPGGGSGNGSGSGDAGQVGLRRRRKVVGAAAAAGDGETPEHGATSTDAGSGAGAGEVDGTTTCPICLSGFETGEQVTALPCHSSHVFHHECIIPWLQRQRACPLCQRDIDLPPAAPATS